MIALSPPLLLATAHAFAAEGDPSKVCRFDGANDAMKASALFVNHLGFHAHRRDAHRSVWPFALTASCEEMVEEAGRMGAVHKHLPDRGDLLLKWSARRQRFMGVGIVVAAWNRSREEEGRAFRARVCVGSAQLVLPENSPCRTTDVRWATIQMMDALPDNGDRFIDWTELGPRNPSRVAWRMPFRVRVSAWRKRVG